MNSCFWKMSGVVAVLFYGVLLSPVSANVADVVEGKINGLHCAQEGIICPV